MTISTTCLNPSQCPCAQSESSHCSVKSLLTGVALEPCWTCQSDFSKQLHDSFCTQKHCEGLKKNFTKQKHYNYHEWCTAKHDTWLVSCNRLPKSLQMCSLCYKTRVICEAFATARLRRVISTFERLNIAVMLTFWVYAKPGVWKA